MGIFDKTDGALWLSLEFVKWYVADLDWLEEKGGKWKCLDPRNPGNLGQPVWAVK